MFYFLICILLLLATIFTLENILLIWQDCERLLIAEHVQNGVASHPVTRIDERIMELVHQLCARDITATKRDLFYSALPRLTHRFALSLARTPLPFASPDHQLPQTTDTTQTTDADE